MTIYIKIVYYAVRALLSPAQVAHLLRLGDELSRLPAFAAAAQGVRRDPWMAKLMSERYIGPHPPAEELERLPEGTLGRAYADFLRSNRLLPYSEYAGRRPARDDAGYLKERARYLHDVAHVALELGTDLPGEAALNAFLLAQIPSPVSAFIVAGCILRTALKEPHHLPVLMEKILEGWARGLRSGTFLAIRWEERWHLSLSEARLLLAG